LFASSTALEGFSFLRAVAGTRVAARQPSGRPMASNWAFESSNRNYWVMRPRSLAISPAHPAGVSNRGAPIEAGAKTNASTNAPNSGTVAALPVSETNAALLAAAVPSTNLGVEGASEAATNQRIEPGNAPTNALASAVHVSNSLSPSVAPTALAVAPLCNESGEARLDSLADLFPALIVQVVSSLPSPPRLAQETGLPDILFFLRNRWTPKIDAGLQSILVEKYGLHWLLMTRLVARDRQIYVEGRLLDLTGVMDPKVEERLLPEDRGQYQAVAGDLAKMLIGFVPAP
jgi:hypothetical protein